ncbi:ATP-binding protein [Nocardioides sp. zg-578]|uniref:ATP-binding protein n=1 Tax=Nocardioides marmotae TaxID=2663857 RepID=A0A6I3J1U7_9ACTN|nr:ATP-binding protein [Nocardioides marmotae]MCR6030690.1 ATP-binding protein [Gordonia jinghuaiqii]MTB86638.1 ATP-binding protein [Nocardioides marmotae]MTB94326.1 ATP-binding protein [Nocardioides marmotae]QKE01644.1 ATP-binding protein [Nocardioides marmotae]
MRTRRSGSHEHTTDITGLVSSAGGRLPGRISVPPAPAEALFPRTVPPRGHRRRGHGWAPTPCRVATYELTSDQAPVVWPLIPGDGLPPWGAELGYDALSGGTFYCDPMGWVADDDIPVTNPNIFIFGKPGRGKSALVKAFILRMVRFGYRGLVLGDVKDEYEGLSRALGVEPFRIGPGLTGRVNPLDVGPLGDGWSNLDAAEQRRRVTVITGRWLTLLRGLAGSQAVPFGPTEERVLTRVLRELVGWEQGATQLAPVTVPEVWAVLDGPTSSLVRDTRHADRQHFLDDTRLLRDALGALCDGSLRGMFDGPSTVHPDWRAPIQTLSLRALHDTGNQAAVGIALMCLNSWGQAMRELAGPGDHRIVLRDEAWLQTRLSLDAVMSLDANLRLSRRDGDVQVVTYHKPSDPLSAGDSGSQAAQIARDLLHLSDIRVLMGQDGEVASELGNLLGLTRMQQDVVTGWAMQEKGRALWLVGDRKFKVQTLLTPLEQRLTYTNDAVAG